MEKKELVGARRSLGRRRGRKRKRGKHFSMSPSRGSGRETCKRWKFPAVARRCGRSPQRSDEKGRLNGRRGGEKRTFLALLPTPPFFPHGSELVWGLPEKFMGGGGGGRRRPRQKKEGRDLDRVSCSPPPPPLPFLRQQLFFLFFFCHLPTPHTPHQPFFRPKKKRRRKELFSTSASHQSLLTYCESEPAGKSSLAGMGEKILSFNSCFSCSPLIFFVKIRNLSFRTRFSFWPFLSLGFFSPIVAVANS